MSFRFACALLSSFLFGFAAVLLQPESGSRQARDGAHRRQIAYTGSHLMPARAPAKNWPHALGSPEQGAFENLWVHRTSLSTNEEPEKLAAAPWELEEALTESESALRRPASKAAPLTPPAISSRSRSRQATRLRELTCSTASTVIPHRAGCMSLPRASERGLQGHDPLLG